MLFWFFALKRPEPFEFYSKIVRPMRAKKKKRKKIVSFCVDISTPTNPCLQAGEMAQLYASCKGRPAAAARDAAGARAQSPMKKKCDRFFPPTPFTK